MSVRVLHSVWSDNSITNQSKLLVMLALADFCDDDGNCWPSMAKIAKKARLSERGARYVVRSLEKDGKITVTIGGRGIKGDNFSNRYTILHSGGQPLPPIDQGGTGSAPPRGKALAPGGGQMDAQQGGTSFAEDPSVLTVIPEPSLEPSGRNPLPPPSLPGLEEPVKKPVNKSRGTLEELKAFAVEIELPETDGESMFLGLEESGWKDVRDWRARMRRWKLNGYHPSQKFKSRNGPPSLAMGRIGQPNPIPTREVTFE